MDVVRALVDEAARRARGLEVARSAVGRYAYVELSDGRAGVAYVDWDWVGPFREYRDLPVDAAEAARLALSYDPVEAAYGVATINALHDGDLVDADPLDVVRVPEGSTVSMVGYIRGYVRRLAGRYKLRVFEARPVDDPSVLPWYAEEGLIPGSDLVIITGVAVVNKTVNRLLELARGSKVVIVGPSTPMIAAPFRGLVLALGGSVVADRDAAYRLVTHGYGAEALLRMRILRKATLVLQGRES